MLEAFNNAQSILFLIASFSILLFAAIVLPNWKRMYYELIYVLSMVVLFTWFIISSQIMASKRWYRRRTVKWGIKKLLYNPSRHVNNITVTGCEEMPPVMSDQMNWYGQKDGEKDGQPKDNRVHLKDSSNYFRFHTIKKLAMESIKDLTEFLMQGVTPIERTYLRYTKKKVLNKIPDELKDMKLRDVLVAIDNTKSLSKQAAKCVKEPK